MACYLGVDIGSVSSNFALLDDEGNMLDRVYLRTNGNPIAAVRQGYEELISRHPGERIGGVGTTGSGRHLAAVLLGADVVKNEITAHAVAAMRQVPGVRTVIEIGGQDSKIIIIRDQVVTDFAMNTVCAAGTGSFLDQQAQRLSIPIEEFGGLALMSTRPVRIAGRCGVFAESDMIHKQQMGYPVTDIIAGLCAALARNYLNNVAKGKDVQGPVVFQGGVAANEGLRRAFVEMLEMDIIVPENHDVMGAIGAALLAREQVSGGATRFKGNEYLVQGLFETTSLDCGGCPNQCEVVCIKRNGRPIAYWGDRCRRFEYSLERKALA